ncbi:3-methyl-2-oxobutanoate hydroxymethyltransferase [Baia soyae]|uniref:3-methyl-2-oxobutanoate hydroxymethyltransferase n=1 Tax=Baia soyae TaxID=1544746 RepID=A0A4R2RZL0_9BACL|nr:3-methyl-2-oxobutanoate hydroxymethyltransferase [Baia soyae]TCP69103.1 ketopantoate hydroxymethyltransferase [Baia soyae]
MKKVTIRTLAKMKREQTPIAMITAYDYPSAMLVEEAGADVILVGDSLGMVVLGYDSTIPVTLADMIHHTKAVTRGAKRAMVIADLPFLVAHLSRDEVLKAAGRLMQEANAYGVKLEGGSEIIDQMQALVQAGVPVMAHLGLQPQSVNKLGGYLIQGKDPSSALHLIEEAKKVEAAGAFALVLECVPEELARQIRDEISIPVIGIGAGRYCDGQVLVFHDVLQIGGGDFQPSFVKRYADVGELIKQGIRSYVEEVKGQQFPAEKHVSHLSPETEQHLYGGGQKEKEGIL